MQGEITVDQNKLTNNYEIKYQGEIIRTVYFDLHDQLFFISNFRKGFDTIEEAIEKVIAIVRAELIQKEIKGKEIKKMQDVQDLNRSQDEIIEEQEAVIVELKKIIDAKDEKIKKLELAITGE
jgi:hypothetical protein